MKLTSLGLCLSTIGLLVVQPLGAQHPVVAKESRRFYEGILIEPISEKKITVKLNSDLIFESDQQKIIFQKNKLCIIGDLNLPSLFCNLAWFDIAPPPSLMLSYLKMPRSNFQNSLKTNYSLNEDGSLSCNELDAIPAISPESLSEAQIWENISSSSEPKYDKIVKGAIVVSYRFPRLIKPIISLDQEYICGFVNYNLVNLKVTQWLFKAAVFEK